MKKRRPLTDEEGEVRELMMEDIRAFRPMLEGLSPSLAAKLGLKIDETKPAQPGEAKSGAAQATTAKRRRKSGIPTGNAGEYFVMGELLRREFDAQLADRNTKGYDALVGAENRPMRRIQVKTVRTAPWYVSLKDFEEESSNQVTIYVLLGPPSGKRPVRFFLATNRDLAKRVHRPPGWKDHGFVNLKAVEPHEDQWDLLLS